MSVSMSMSGCYTGMFEACAPIHMRYRIDQENDIQLIRERKSEPLDISNTGRSSYAILRYDRNLQFATTTTTINKTIIKKIHFNSHFIYSHLTISCHSS